MMDYAALKSLIDTHPTAGTTSDEDMALWLNDPDGVTRDRANIPTAEIFEICMANDTEWRALAADDAQIVRDIMVVHSPSGIPTDVGSASRTQLVAILGTSTKQAIAAVIPENVSRAADAGFPTIRVGDVEYARTF